MTLQIRQAREDDASRVFTLASRLATSFAVEIEAFKVTFFSVVKTSYAVILVAESEGVLVGYVLGFCHHAFYANGRVAWVEEIIVEGNLRRQKIGKLLMREFETWAHGHDCKLIALATRRAAAFYTAIGYEESATYFRKLL